MTLEPKIQMAIATAALTGALVFFGYASYDYVNAACFDDMKQTELDAEVDDLFDSLATLVTGLRKGTGYVSKWESKKFQDEVDGAHQALMQGRRAFKRHEGLTVLRALNDMEAAISRAKRIATTRVNDILAKQNPADPDAFEKGRLEGKNLVAIVKEIDGGLEQLAARTRKPPGMCDW